MSAIANWLKAWRSFLRGADGLDPWQQVDRNLTVAIGNLVVAVVIMATAVIIKIVTWWV